MRSVAIVLAALLVGAPASAQVREFHVPHDAPKVSAVLPMISNYIAPAVYEQWWQEIAACEQLPLPVTHYRVRWYQINAGMFFDGLQPIYARDSTGQIRHDEEGHVFIMWAAAISYPGALEAFVSLPYMFEQTIIKHEMVHFLMAWAGEPGGHPKERFDGRCGLTITYAGKK